MILTKLLHPFYLCFLGHKNVIFSLKFQGNENTILLIQRADLKDLPTGNVLFMTTHTYLITMKKLKQLDHGVSVRYWNWSFFSWTFWSSIELSMYFTYVIYTVTLTAVECIYLLYLNTAVHLTLLLHNVHFKVTSTEYLFFRPLENIIDDPYIGFNPLWVNGWIFMYSQWLLMQDGGNKFW